MCLIAVAWQCSERFPLVVVGNRDELHERPTLPAAPWVEAPEVLGGRDLQAGGSWLAVSRQRRLAAVTNLRTASRVAAPRSRGDLVREFVVGRVGASAAAAMTLLQGEAFGPYNLLLWDGRELMHATNRPQPSCAPLAPGVHGVSNGPIDARWPKVSRLTQALREWLARAPDTREPQLEPLFAALADERGAPDDELPDTGVGIAVERRLAPAFIRDARYGTRASTVVLVGSEGQVSMVERNFGPDGARGADVRLSLAPAGASWA